MEKKSSYRIHPKHFFIFFLICSAYYLIFFKDDPMIDFIPLYTVGHIWRTDAGDFYYDYGIKEFAKKGFVIETAETFDKYARNLGFNDPKNRTTLYIYYPAFIPLFSILSLIPLLWMKVIFHVLSCFIVLFTLKSIIETIFESGKGLIVFYCLIIPVFFSSIFQWSIGAGQFTPYLFAGTWFALILQQRGRYIIAGFLLAAMTWFKFFPGILILIWLLEKDIKAMISFTIFFIMIFASAFIFFDMNVMKDYMTTLKIFSSGICLVWVNQSIDAFLMRFYFPIQNSGEPVSFPLIPNLKILTLVLKALLLLSWFYFTKRIIMIRDEIKSGEVSIMVSGYYLLGVCILLFPISWIHYFIYFIPLGLWLLKYETEKKTVSSVSIRILLAVGFVMLFMLQESLSHPVNLLIKLFGKNTAAFCARILLSCHLLGGLLMLILAQIKINRIERFIKDGNQADHS